MLPPASTQSSVRCPLNEVFGSKGQVRLLRVLAAETSRLLRPPEIGIRAGMTESGARRGLRRLARTGLVEQLENGTGSGYRLSRENPLAREVARLFDVERSRCEALAGTLRGVLRTLPAPPRAAWLQEFLGGWSDCQEVAVSWGSETPEAVLTELKDRLTEVEDAFDVALEVRAVPQAEIAEVDGSEVVTLIGDLPNPAGGPSRENPIADRGRLNPESPEFSEALVALLEENLSVIRRARECVRGQLGDRPNGHVQDLWEWQKILDTFSFPRLLHFLGSDSPRAVRLRECSPFPTVLSEEEKARLIELAGGPH